MTEQKHTPEPWPAFTDICQPATPHPESPAIAMLSWDDYIRARACVNACAGIETEDLERHYNAGGGIDSAMEEAALRDNVKVWQQRDQLRAALKAIADPHKVPSHGDPSELREYVRAALAATE